MNSPYYGIDATIPSGSYGSPINILVDNRLNSVFEVMLTRFYILSQFTYHYGFYNHNLFNSIRRFDNESQNPELAKMHGVAEAYNISSSMTNGIYVDMMKTVSEHLSNPNNITNFYKYIETYLPNLYNFTEIDKTSLSDSGNIYYLNKGVIQDQDTPFVGVSIIEDDIVIRTFNEDGSKPIDIFQKSQEDSWFSFLGIGDKEKSVYDFTETNVLYLKDEKKEDGNINTETRFVSPFIIGAAEVYEIPFVKISGNTSYYIRGSKPNKESKSLEIFGNIYDKWIYNLTNSDKYILEILKNSNDSEFNSIVILSNLGSTVSPFNIFPNALNDTVFKTPSAIQVPVFLNAYVGSLIDRDMATISNYYGNKEPQINVHVYADIFDVNKYLSFNDKRTFKAKYDSFMSTNYGDIYDNLIAILEEGVKLTSKNRAEYYEKQFNYKDESAKGTIILSALMERKTLVNYSNITFDMSNKDIVGYKSLKSINETSTIYKDTNNKYFTEFFKSLYASLSSRKTDLVKEKKEFDRMTGDEDIITQGYYSFKNINDKWLTSPNDSKNNDNENLITIGDNLIDSFAFVDRAMRPIGNTIINPEMLIDMMNNQDISVFTVLTQMLSANGFEFFPIQNFMSHDNNGWRNSFKIDVSTSVVTKPSFVCMYVGGSSSYPSGIYKGSQFEDDGIQDIKSTEFATDNYSISDNLDAYRDGQISGSKLQGSTNRGNTTFKYGQVRAFWVKFAQQNQSMFSNIKIDSKEYPETNESIQILSRIAGDGKLQAPPPKGQNLFSVYENRAYKATITGLGNVMIQPTQYFQLANVPLYSGVYLILGVEHNIEPNKMTTTFTGTKILKYPVPRVLTPSAIYGYDGGDSDMTSPYGDQGNYTGAGAGAYPQTQFNSMYELKI